MVRTLSIPVLCRFSNIRTLVIDQAWSGREPDLLVELRSAAEDLGGGDVRAALRGDLHLHSNWSDGSAPIEEMMATAAELGHEYCALTDHSPRLTIANGLSPERLRKQLDVIEGLREKFAPMRILTGIEGDILDDGSLDQEASCWNASTSWWPACTRSCGWMLRR